MATYLLVENDFGLITDIISFDVTLAEQHEDISIVTEFPVEEGASVSDHIRSLPKALSVEVFVSNTPIRPNILKFRGRYDVKKLDLPTPFNFPRLFPGPLAAVPGAGTRAALAAIEGRMIPPIRQAYVLTFDPFDAVGETYNALISIKDEGSKLRVVTGLTEYTNMILVRVGTPRTIDDGTGATFQLDMRTVRKVSPLSVEAPAIPLEPNGGPKKNRGGQGAALVDDETTRKVSRSMLLGIAEAALGPI